MSDKRRCAVCGVTLFFLTNKPRVSYGRMLHGTFKRVIAFSTLQICAVNFDSISWIAGFCSSMVANGIQGGNDGYIEDLFPPMPFRCCLPVKRHPSFVEDRVNICVGRTWVAQVGGGEYACWLNRARSHGPGGWNVAR